MSTDRTPVETALNARRRALRRTWKDVYDRAGISHETMRQLRLEEPVAEDTESAVEDALALERGSIAAVRRTRDPEAATPAAGPPAPGANDGAEWLDSTPLPGGGTEWRLTRIIDGRPASYSLADFDGTAESEIRAELQEVMNVGEIQQRRRLARRKSL